MILNDNEASENDKFVALEMIKNANISSAGVLPMCQDTGTAIVLGYKGENIFTGVDDSKLISQGIYDTYQTKNLRYSQVAPLSMFDEVNTNNNLPAQIEIYSATGNEYKFAFIQKGGGSANKSFLYQKTKSVLNPESLRSFLYEAIINIGTSACPPYHLAIVIGGMSAEFNMKTLKLASIRYLDKLPKKGDNIRKKGEDIKKNKVAFNKGKKIRTVDLTQLSSLGLKKIKEPFLKEISEIINPKKADAIVRNNLPPSQLNFTSDDYTEMCWHTPTARLYIGRPMLTSGQDVKYPDWVMNALGGIPETINPMIFTASKTIALSFLKILKNPKILKDAKKEFKKRTGGGINGKHWLPPLCDYKPPFEHRWPEYFYTKNKKKWNI